MDAELAAALPKAPGRTDKTWWRLVYVGGVYWLSTMYSDRGKIWTGATVRIDPAPTADISRAVIVREAHKIVKTYNRASVKEERFSPESLVGIY